MPPKSKQQQKAAGMAVAMKKGKMPIPAKGGGPAAQMARSMSTMQAEEFASGSTKGLPKRAGKPVTKRTVKT